MNEELKTVAWLIESYDRYDNLSKRVVLSPLTVELDDTQVAIALCTLEDAIAYARALPSAQLEQAQASAPVADERAAFEKQFTPKSPAAEFWMRRTRSGDYSNAAIERAWQGWLARAALAQPAAPITCQIYGHVVGHCGECNVVDEGAKDVQETIKVLADNYLRLTCGSAAPAVADERLKLIMNGDPTWLLEYVKENSIFDVDLLTDVFRLAKERASQLSQPAAPAEQKNVNGLTRSEFEQNLRVGFQHDNVRSQERGRDVPTDSLTASQEREIKEIVELNYPPATNARPRCSGCEAFDGDASEVNFIQGCEGCKARMQKIAGWGPLVDPVPPAVADGELPPLPEPDGFLDDRLGQISVYCGDTVQAYARAYGQECARKAGAGEVVGDEDAELLRQAKELQNAFNEAIVPRDGTLLERMQYLGRYVVALKVAEAAPAAVPQEPVRLSEVQIDNIRNDVMKQLSAENNGVIGGPDVEHMQFPKRFAEAIMTAMGSTPPCCAICGDDGRWMAGYTGLFGGMTPVYEACTCAAAPTPPAAPSGEADAKDAERYRWLKRQRNAAPGYNKYSEPTITFDLDFFEAKQQWMRAAGDCKGIDFAIDAAIAAQAKE